MVYEMKNINQKYRYAVHVKNYMKNNGNYFIKNNERTRKQLNMNKKQLTYAINYLKKTGYLKSWSKKVYKLEKN
jgi:hypothetical protein